MDMPNRRDTLPASTGCLQIGRPATDRQDPAHLFHHTTNIRSTDPRIGGSLPPTWGWTKWLTARLKTVQGDCSEKKQLLRGESRLLMEI